LLTTLIITTRRLKTLAIMMSIKLAQSNFSLPFPYTKINIKIKENIEKKIANCSILLDTTPYSAYSSIFLCRYTDSHILFADFTVELNVSSVISFFFKISL